jgi:SulP family sulfate permease
MDFSARPQARATGPSFRELFLPKLATVLQEGYGLSNLRADALAGLTVAIVALPLSMAIAIGSGVSPERGLYTAIVGGFLISLLGGSRFQIGGPAAAFIALIALTVDKHGYDGLVLATLIAGLLLMVAGFFRLGTYIKYIPFPVTIGFTAGIAVIIFVTQMHDFLGLRIPKEPSEFVPKLAALWSALPTINPIAVAVSLLSVAIILAVRRFRPTWPALLFAVVAAAAITAGLHLDVETIGSRFGVIPSGLPSPSLPAFSLEKIRAVLPDAVALALLGAIESLLSAVVADGMSGGRHRSNGELVAQGIGNIASVMFGGICATGTIARTATNIRAGARGPISGVFHSAYLLIFVLFAMPLVAYIPLASLAAVLVVVAWSMADKADFASLLRTSWSDAAVLLATFLLTIFADLLTGIAVGTALGSFVFLHRMAQAAEVNGGDSERAKPEHIIRSDSDVMVYRLSGAFFFGATSQINLVLDRVVTPPRVFILDFSDVPFIDITAARALGAFVQRLKKSGATVLLTGVRPHLRRPLTHGGLVKPAVRYVRTIEAALAESRAAHR